MSECLGRPTSGPQEEITQLESLGTNSVSQASYFFRRRRAARNKAASAPSGTSPLETVDHADDWFGYNDDDPAVPVQSFIALTLDSGAGATVFPYHLPAMDESTNRGLRFSTATGEQLKSGVDCRVSGWDRNGKHIGFKACRAEVQNPLISVGEVTVGNFVAMWGNTGTIIPRSAPCVKKFLKELAIYQKSGGAYTPVSKERNVYKVHLEIPNTFTNHEVHDMTDGDMHVENHYQKTQKRKRNDDMQCDAVQPSPFRGQPQPGA